MTVMLDFSFTELYAFVVTVYGMYLAYRNGQLAKRCKEQESRG